MNPYEKAMQGTQYGGTIQTLKEQYDHLGSYRGQYSKVSPRFTQINRTVGEFMSLQQRINQDY